MILFFLVIYLKKGRWWMRKVGLVLSRFSYTLLGRLNETVSFSRVLVDVGICEIDIELVSINEEGVGLFFWLCVVFSLVRKKGRLYVLFYNRERKKGLWCRDSVWVF